jgi:hypothetical protein
VDRDAHPTQPAWCPLPLNRRPGRCRRDWLVTKQAIQESQLEDKIRGLSEHDLQLLKIHMSQCKPRCRCCRPAAQFARPPGNDRLSALPAVISEIARISKLRQR